MRVFFSSLMMMLLLGLAPLSAGITIPLGTWEQHPEGVALAMLLTNQAVGGQAKEVIQVLIRNTSTTPKHYVGPDLYNLVVEIFYVNNDGKQVPLRDYTPPTDPPQPPPLINPGATFLRTVELTPDESALIKTHPVCCHVSIADESVQHYSFLQSTPKLLMPTP